MTDHSTPLGMDAIAHPWFSKTLYAPMGPVPDPGVSILTNEVVICQDHKVAGNEALAATPPQESPLSSER